MLQGGLWQSMPLRAKLFHIWFLLSRPMTLGVRMAAINQDGEIMLVKHTYVTGWHLPGGGVDAGESCNEAVIRELTEETGLVPQKQPQIFNIYFNTIASKRDHVALYQCQTLSDGEAKTPDKEIAEARFFPLDNLPSDTSAGTRRRLAEMFEGAEISPHW